MSELMSISDAARTGIQRIRRPHWSNPYDHIKIDIVEGVPGPWLHLFAPVNLECNGRDPMSFLGVLMGVDIKARIYEPYLGPLPDSDAYKQAQAAYKGTLRK